MVSGDGYCSELSPRVQVTSKWAKLKKKKYRNPVVHEKNGFTVQKKWLQQCGRDVAFPGALLASIPFVLLHIFHAALQISL